MIYVFIVLLVVFCVYESYSLIMSVRKKRYDKKESSLKSTEIEEIGEYSVEENSQENLKKGEKQD